ncbi:MAG: M28 family peptidase, partial [Longimicrobiales bacterium]
MPGRGIRPWPRLFARTGLWAFILVSLAGCRSGAPGEGPQASGGPVAGPEEARRAEAGDPQRANAPEARGADPERGAGDLLPRPAVLDEYQHFAREAISGARAREMVAALDPSYRVPGNEPFNRAIAGVVEVLKAAGYREEGHGEGYPLSYRVERRALSGPTWEVVQASLSLAGATRPLMELASNVNLVAANSFSTSPGGVEGEVVFVGPGTAEDFEGMAVRGKIVLGDGSVRQLFRRAVQEHGALGVLAYRLPDFNRPEENRTVAPMSSIPYDSVSASWGLLLSADARDALVEALEVGPVKVHVDIETRLYSSEELTLVAEVRGSSRPEERFVFSAHVQESGANDNLTGVAALSEIARALGEGVRSGFLTPDRTITMLWGDEISSTRRFLEEDTVRAAGVRWGLSLDMVGEDTDKTGGTFLIEKMPDPSAVWTRGQDRHTEWGGRPLTPDQLTPHYLNDFVLNRCMDQAAGSGWVVGTNPYEGGSDHVPFLQAGTAGVLFWHFTDQFYHTDGDRME